MTASHASMVSQPEAVTQLILSRRGDEQQPDVRLCDSHPTMRRPCHRASILRSPVMTVRPQGLAAKLPLVSHVHDQRADHGNRDSTDASDTRDCERNPRE